MPFMPASSLWRRVPLILAGMLLVFGTGLAAVVAFGTAPAPPAIQPSAEMLAIRQSADLPALRRYTARDGTPLAYRFYAGGERQVAIFLHGTSCESSCMHAVARTLQEAGASVYALDLRGHGGSGRRGDIDYIGQLDDDIADVVQAIRPAHPDAHITLVGFSGGGGLALRVAGGRYGPLFDDYLLISPAITYPAPFARPGTGGWAAPSLPRIAGLIILDTLGIHAFDGLDAIAFAVPPGNRTMTGVYSFRLMMNLATLDYAAWLARTRQPMVLLAGGDDEQFYADRYAPLLQPAKPDLSVEIVPGLGHLAMISQAPALAALRRTFLRLSDLPPG